MISISVDPAHDTKEVLKAWANYFNATWIHARDTADPPSPGSLELRLSPPMWSSIRREISGILMWG